MNEFNLNFYKGKKVLVTGHTGFKGTWLCRILQELGAEVTGYSQKPPTDPSIFTLTDLESQIHSVIGDIRDLEHMIQVFKETQPEIVFHLAAQPIVRESYKNPVNTYETNVMGTVNVLEAVRQCGSVRSFLNVTIKFIRIMNGNGGTAKRMNWMATTRIPIANPAQNL